MSNFLSRFGFSFDKPAPQVTPIAPRNEEQAYDIHTHAGGFGIMGTSGLAGQIASDNKLIERYREVAEMPEVDNAIEEIISEMIVVDSDADPVLINTDGLENVSAATKKKIQDSFAEVLDLLNFNVTGYDIAKRFYIDGRIYFYMQSDPKNKKKGLTSIEYVDPRKIKPVREIEANGTGVFSGIGGLYTVKDEYYVYSESMVDNTNGTYYNAAPQSQAIVRIEKDAVAHATSGLMDKGERTILSFLHKALRVATQVMWLETSVLIYYLSRAPERRAFYISTMNIPKPKRESFMREVMARFSNKIAYDPATGGLNDERKLMNLNDDYWIPRDDVSEATRIENISGASNLSDMTIPVDNFREKLLKSLNVPISRLDPSSSMEFSMSATEVNRDELKFTRFIRRLRARFTNILNEALRAQLILKGVISVDEWDEICGGISYEFTNDNHFAEIRDTEVLQKRMRIADDAKTMLGMFFTLEQIQKRIMKMTDEDIAEVEKYRKDNPAFEVDREGNMNVVPTDSNGMPLAAAGIQAPPPPAPEPTQKKKKDKPVKESMNLDELDVNALLEKHGLK